MKVLFIIHDVYQNDNEFPLGPAYLSSILRENGYVVDTYCMDVYHYTNEQLAKYLDKNEYDMICLGFMSARFVETVLPLCKVINEHKKNALFVLGGPGASATPEYILNKTGVDSVVVGEAENVILDVKEGLNRGEPVKNLDKILFPAWDLFPMERYTTCIKNPGMSDNERMLILLSSRGCVNKCSFCFRLEKGLRMRSIPNIIEEIKILNKKYGVTYFEFADEFFALSKKRIGDFNQLLEENNLKIKYWCASRVKGVDREVLQLMKDGGCVFINYGFESMDADVLKQMRKNTTPEDNENAAKLTKEAGILFGVNFIWNNPGDSVKSLWENVEFIKKYNTYGQVRTIRPVTPYPTCPLYYKAIEDGLLEGAEDFYNKFSNSDLIMINFTDMEKKEMYKELFLANSELINNHAKNTNMDRMECTRLKDNFYSLYFKGETKFRGARNYEKSTKEYVKGKKRKTL